MLNIINKRKYTYVLSIILVLASIFVLSKWGLNLGIDFRGGTLMEVQFTEEENEAIEDTDSSLTEKKEEGTQEFKAPERKEIEEKLSELNLKSLIIQPTENNGAIIRYIASDESLNEEVISKLGEFDGDVEQLRVDFIGSSISEDLKENAILAIILAIFGIALYIAWAFRKVSRPIPSWQYGLGAVIALAHDVALVLGVFAILGEFYSVEVGIPFVAALLTILGYSVNDTIVVYDRTRENILRLGSKNEFKDLVNKSLNETLARSINTSLTVIVVLLAIIFFGGESIKYFSIALLLGVIFGTYSSIFVASSLLVTSYNHKYRNKT